MNRKRVKKKQLSILILTSLILLISIGYAVLTSNLTINGTSTINNPTWDVHWNNVQITNGSVTGTKVTTAAHILTGLTEVEYSITLSNPGDFYEFTVDAVNTGSIDAMIGSFSNKVFESNGTTERTLPDYLTYTVTYSDGVLVANNHKLAASSTEKYKVRVEYKRDIDASILPSSQDTLIFKFSVEYVQADNNSIIKPDPDIYNISSVVMQIGNGVPNGVTTYTNYQDAIAAFGHDFFIRHHSTTSTITSTEIGFIYNNNLYYLIGSGETYNSQGNYYEYDSIYYSGNKSELLRAFGNGACDADVSCGDSCLYTECQASGLRVSAINNGYISIREGATSCVVYDDGTSKCE